MPLPSAPYLAAFRILSEDFRRASEYVELADENLGTFSHRLYELLLRACTEFESACKGLLVGAGYPTPASDMNLGDYKKLEKPLGLEETEVGILNWLPTKAYVKPFEGWTTNRPALRWYASYNDVKHNRLTAFPLANLDNVRLAIAGHFALLAMTGAISRNVSGMMELHIAATGKREYVFPGYALTLVSRQPPQVNDLPPYSTSGW